MSLFQFPINKAIRLEEFENLHSQATLQVSFIIYPYGNFPWKFMKKTHGKLMSFPWECVPNTHDFSMGFFHRFSMENSWFFILQITI